MRPPRQAPAALVMFAVCLIPPAPGSGAAGGGAPDRRSPDARSNPLTPPSWAGDLASDDVERLSRATTASYADRRAAIASLAEALNLPDNVRNRQRIYTALVIAKQVRAHELVGPLLNQLDMQLGPVGPPTVMRRPAVDALVSIGREARAAVLKELAGGHLDRERERLLLAILWHIDGDCARHRLERMKADPAVDREHVDDAIEALDAHLAKRALD